MRFHKSVSFDNVDELESYIGSEKLENGNQILKTYLQNKHST